MDQGNANCLIHKTSINPSNTLRIPYPPATTHNTQMMVNFTLIISERSYNSMANVSIWIPPKQGNATRAKIILTSGNFHGNKGYQPI